MSSRVVKLDASAHQAVSELLPWYAMETLDESDRLRVDAHLAGCAQCREELEWHRMLRAVHAVPADAHGVEKSLAALHPRLDQRRDTPTGGPSGGSWWRAWLRSAPSLRWVAALEALALAGLALLIANPPPGPMTPSYRGLGSAPGGGNAPADVVVLFAPQTREFEMRQILQTNGAHVVGGPTESGAYLLVLPPASREAALAALQRESAVLLAQPLVASPQP